MRFFSNFLWQKIFTPFLMVIFFTSHVHAEKLMIFGDSLIAGYGLRGEDNFPTQLGVSLAGRGYDVDIINAGVSGDTSAGGRARLDWALAEQPDYIMLVLGGNDMLRGLDPQATYENLRAMLIKLNAYNKPVLLCGMLAAANLGRDYRREFDALYPKLAAEFDLIFYPFFLEGVALQPHLNQADGLHPNKQGVAKITQSILPYVERLLKKKSV